MDRRPPTLPAFLSFPSVPSLELEGGIGAINEVATEAHVVVMAHGAKA